MVAVQISLSPLQSFNQILHFESTNLYYQSKW